MIEGYDEWRRKLPAYQGWRILVFPLLAIVSIIVGQGYLVALESLSRLYPDIAVIQAVEPVLPIVGTLTGLVAGFLGIYQLWARRDRYLAESKKTAYQRALPYGVVGAGLLVTTMLNGLLPAYQFSRQTLSHPLSVLFATPLGPWSLRLLLGGLLLVFAVTFGVRTIRTFGIDYMLVVYLYYPEESTVQDHEIYSMMRHPTYAGWLVLVLSTTVLRASIYGLVDFLLFYLALVLWLRGVEERELVDRFGDDYREYMNTVPAFVPRAEDWTDFFAFFLNRG